MESSCFLTHALFPNSLLVLAAAGFKNPYDRHFHILCEKGFAGFSTHFQNGMSVLSKAVISVIGGALLSWLPNDGELSATLP